MSKTGKARKRDFSDFFPPFLFYFHTITRSLYIFMVDHILDGTAVKTGKIVARSDDSHFYGQIRTRFKNDFFWRAPSSSTFLLAPACQPKSLLYHGVPKTIWSGRCSLYSLVYRIRTNGVPCPIIRNGICFFFVLFFLICRSHFRVPIYRRLSQLFFLVRL